MQIDTVIFCKRQDNYVKFMDKIKIAKVTEFKDWYDPITDKFTCRSIIVEVPKIIGKLYLSLLHKMISEYGIYNRDRLVTIGAITICE